MKLKARVNGSEFDDFFKIFYATSKILTKDASIRFSPTHIIISAPREDQKRCKFELKISTSNFFSTNDYTLLPVLGTDSIVLNVNVSAQTGLTCALQTFRNKQGAIDCLILSLIKDRDFACLSLAFHENYDATGQPAKHVQRVDVVSRRVWDDYDNKISTHKVHSCVKLKDSVVFAQIINRLKWLPSDCPIRLTITQGDNDATDNEDLSFRVEAIAPGSNSLSRFPGSFVQVYEPENFLNENLDTFDISASISAKDIATFLNSFAAANVPIVVGIRQDKYVTFKLKHKTFVVEHVLPAIQEATLD